MPKVRRPYSRVYWEVIDDPKFADVWDDNHSLATWLRLLLAADMAWPASASIYHGVNRQALDKIVRVGLVDLQPGSRFRIHGLDKERESRSDAARDAVSTRYARSTPVVRPYTEPNYAGTTERLPSKDETRRDEQSTANHAPATDDPDDDVTTLQKLAESLTGTPYGFPRHGGMGEKVGVMLRKHGLQAIEAEWRRIAGEERGMPTVRQLVLGADNALNRISVPAPAGKRDEVAEYVAKVKAQTREEAARA